MRTDGSKRPSCPAYTISMLSYDDLMNSIDPDPFFNSDLNGEALYVSQSSDHTGLNFGKHGDKYEIVNDQFNSLSGDENLIADDQLMDQNSDSDDDILLNLNNDSDSSKQSLSQKFIGIDSRNQTQWNLADALCSIETDQESKLETLEKQPLLKKSNDTEQDNLQNMMSCWEGVFGLRKVLTFEESSDEDSVSDTETIASISLLENYGEEYGEERAHTYVEVNDFHDSFHKKDDSNSVTPFMKPSINALDERDPTPTFHLMRNKQWELVHQRINSHPHELEVWIFKRDYLRGSIKWAVLPIHAACIFGCPSSVMRSMIKTYPKGITSGDSGWRLPIHIACFACISANHVRLLLEASPPSVNVADVFGHRCITLALESNGPEKAEVLRVLDSGVIDTYATGRSSSPPPKQEVKKEKTEEEQPLQEVTPKKLNRFRNRMFFFKKKKGENKEIHEN